MASTKQLDPRVLEFLKRVNNGKAQAEADYAGLPTAPVAHPEDWNHPPPEGSIKPDPYGNALIDTVAGGITGVLRPSVTTATEAASEAAHIPTSSASVSREELQSLSPTEILRRLGNSRAETRAITEAPPTDKVTSRIYEAVRKLDPEHAGSKSSWEDTVSPAREQAREAATGNFTPPKQMTGEVPVTGVNKAPAPGEAVYGGKTPGQRQLEQAEVLKKHREVNGYATGGVVPAAATAAPHHVYAAARDCVTKYCSGGVANYAAGGPVEPSDVNDEYTPELIPQAEVLQPAPPVPQNTGVPRGAEQPAEQPIADPKVAEGNAQLRQADDPAARRLALLEQYRASALQGSEPTTGQRVARSIGSALTAFGGGKPTDFAAEDRANRGEINASYDRQRKDFLSAPGELAARAGNDSNSQDSMKFRGLVAKALGIDVNGLSSAQVSAALPFIQTANVAKVSGNQLEMQREAEKGRQAVEAHKEDVDAQKLEIDRRNADTNRLRASLQGAAHGETKIENYFKAEEALKNAPDVRQADLDILAIKKINEILANPDPDTNAIAKLKAELAKIATGGEGSQHLQDELGRPTLRGKLSEAIQMVTGQPGSAGYRDIIKQSIKPYVKDIDRVVRQQRIQHELEVLKKHASTLDPAFVKQRHQQILDEAKDGETEPSAADKIKSKYGDRARPSD